MMSKFDEIIFKDKKFSDILEEIYSTKNKREKQIKSLIKELSPLIKDTGSAAAVVPLLKEYLEIGVKNDEHLIKMATIVQRVITSSDNGEGSGGITEEEEEELRKLAADMNENKPDESE